VRGRRKKGFEENKFALISEQTNSQKKTVTVISNNKYGVSKKYQHHMEKKYCFIL